MAKLAAVALSLVAISGATTAFATVPPVARGAIFAGYTTRPTPPATIAAATMLFAVPDEPVFTLLNTTASLTQPDERPFTLSVRAGVAGARLSRRIPAVAKFTGAVALNSALPRLSEAVRRTNSPFSAQPLAIS